EKASGQGAGERCGYRHGLAVTEQVKGIEQADQARADALSGTVQGRVAAVDHSAAGAPGGQPGTEVGLLLGGHQVGDTLADKTTQAQAGSRPSSRAGNARPATCPRPPRPVRQGVNHLME